MARIALADVAVDFPVYDGTQRSIRRALVDMAVGGAIVQRGRHLAVRALDGICLDIQDGDRVGLIGGNGSGKTTLLQVLAGFFPPTAGRIRIEGQVATLLGADCILDPDMTGIENIEHAIVLLGIPGSRQHLTDEIGAFTELGDYLSLPVKTYSAGMKLRLSFALMTAQQSDVLLIDEVLSVGDVRFRAKARERILQAAGVNRIVVLATHVEAEIRDYCTRLVWLHQGRVMGQGPVAQVLETYHHWLTQL